MSIRVFEGVPKERGERCRTPIVFPAGRDAAARSRRSPHCFSVGNARARYSHTASRRAAPRRVVRVHNTCFTLTLARCRRTRTTVREPANPAGSEALPPMHNFRWVLERYAAGHYRKGIFCHQVKEHINKTYAYWISSQDSIIREIVEFKLVFTAGNFFFF